MKFSTLKILIAAAFILVVSSVLSACGSQGNSELGVERIQEVQEMKKSVELALTQIEGETDNVVRITLKNPEKRPVTSVQAWLAYNPDHLRGISVDTTQSAFGLMAPYDNTFDQEGGLLMLGRSNTEPVSDAEIVVADVHFQKITDGTAMIEAYNYRQDISGHSSVNMMLDGAPLNILIKPPSPLIAIQ